MRHIQTMVQILLYDMFFCVLVILIIAMRLFPMRNARKINKTSFKLSI